MQVLSVLSFFSPSAVADDDRRGVGRLAAAQQCVHVMVTLCVSGGGGDRRAGGAGGGGIRVDGGGKEGGGGLLRLRADRVCLHTTKHNTGGA